MVLCIEAVHKLGWMHRDIKPDNFLIGANGHLKISDFGLAFDGQRDHCQTYYADKRQQLLDMFRVKVNGDAQDVAEAFSRPIRDPASHQDHNLRPLFQPDIGSKSWLLESFQDCRKNARSVVGTSQYMAPEIVLGMTYDGRCDWWSLGVLVYEMLYGRTPFYDECHQRTKENIMAYSDMLVFPIGPRCGRPNSSEPRSYDTPSETAIDFVLSLLVDRDQRLGSRAYRYPALNSKRRDSALDLEESNLVKAFDADEVKSHPWFEAVPWSVMDQRRPPWTPNVAPGQSVTKYFEDEPDILADDGFIQKRSRDKVLRDPELGPCALKERRRTAFFGYTYRRLTAETQIPGFERPRIDACLDETKWCCNVPE